MLNFIVLDVGVWEWECLILCWWNSSYSVFVFYNEIRICNDFWNKPLNEYHNSLPNPKQTLNEILHKTLNKTLKQVHKSWCQHHNHPYQLRLVSSFLSSSCSASQQTYYLIRRHCYKTILFKSSKVEFNSNNNNLSPLS